MSQVANGSETMPVELMTLYAPISTELKQCEEILRRELTSNHPHIDEMVLMVAFWEANACALRSYCLRPRRWASSVPNI